MSMVKHEELEAITPPIIYLKDGRRFVTEELLTKAKTDYQTTRVLYTRDRLGKVVPAGTTRGKRTKTPKYSLEEAQWMWIRTAKQIAERYNISVAKAHYIRHYSATFWKL